MMLPLLMLSAFSWAQQTTVSGRVISKASGEPLVGVSITTSNTKIGTSTGEDGRFTLKVDSKIKDLIFSYTGFSTQLIPLDGRASYDIQLEAAKIEESEVVVVGYGTQKKSSVTGAVSKYQNPRLNELAVSRLDQALQGKIAGVQIQNISPEAGAEPKVQVRGLSSINAGASPLVVVDGHPIPDGLSFVNMSDVSSVEVLKDAASAAIYGSRGASGVILITTKSGKADKPKFNVKISAGIKDAYQLYPMMTTTEYTEMLFNEAAIIATDPSVPPLTPGQIASTAERGAYIIENDMRGGESTDWQKEAIRSATISNVQMNVSGGNKGVRYYISGGYQNDQGMMYHSEYERFNIKSRIDATLSNKVKMSFNINPSYVKRERPSVGFIDFVRFGSYLPVHLDESLAAFVREDPAYADVKAGDFAQARYFNGRVYSGTMPDGSNWVNTSVVTPFNTANNTPKSAMETRTINSDEYRALTGGDLTYSIVPGLDLKVLGSAYVSYTNTLDFAQRNSNRAGDVNRGQYNNRLFVDLLNENTLTYSKQLKDHSFNALAGFTVQKTQITNEQSVGLDYPSDNIRTLNTALTIDQANTFNNKNQIGLLSYLGRLSYAYKDKYLVTGSFRADGSSYFAPENKWGYFPSVSVGWVASKESFLENVNWMSNLKLRASYGAVGNNRIVDFAFVDLLYAANYPTGAGTGTVGLGQRPSNTILSNENITWETTFTYNFGVDFSLLKNRLAFSIDVYQAKTDKLLLQQPTLGFTGVPLSWNNIGQLKNNGFEFEVTSYNIKNKDFSWTTTANFAHTQNELVQLGTEAFLLNQGERTELYRNKLGDPLVTYFGYKTDGVWLSQAQIDEERAKGLKSSLSNVFVPGGLKLVDLNGDMTIDADDRTVIGNPYPDFTWGINNSFTYKGFDLNFLFQGVQGGSLINGDANYNETKRYNKNYNANRYLSPANPGDGKTPYSTFGFNWMLTDYVVEDASYFALRELLVGYTLPSTWAKKMKLSSLRLYASAQNVFFHAAANYRGINPEGRMTSGPYATSLIDGYQRGTFPFQRAFSFGIDLNFQ